MYIASKLFTYLVLPPGIFIILLLVASFFAKKFKKTLFLSALFFYALSNSYVADFLLSPLEKPYNKTFKNPKADAVVILGGGHITGVANTPLLPSAYKRALWGIILSNKYNLPILFSGGGLNSSYSEADAFLDVVKELKEGLHVEVNLLKTENKSLDTYENAKYSKEIFKHLNIEKPTILLVTSAYHMNRSIKLYEHFGFRVIPMATDFQISYHEKTIWDLFPNIGAFKRSYTALHEYFGLLNLYLRGIY